MGFKDFLKENQISDFVKGQRVVYKQNRSFGPGIILAILKSTSKIRVMFDKDNPDLDDVDPKFYDISPQYLEIEKHGR